MAQMNTLGANDMRNKQRQPNHEQKTTITHAVNK